MTGIRRSMVGLAVVLLAVGAAGAADAVTLEGEFVWERTDGDHSGKLRAVFTPTGEREWGVAFHFDWEDGPHVYTGSATGSLEDGDLAGEVRTDNEESQATFRFNGTFDGGTFEGTHGHVQEDGSLRATGRMTLGPQG